ncbi:MAG: FMN-binding protein [Lachnospira sp.]
MAVVTSLKYIARISKSVRINKIFHHIHIPAGIAMVCIGLLHGLVAGNAPWTELKDVHIGTILLSLNWGTACLVVSVLLGISYLLRKILKKNWMRIHRILTVVLLVLIVVHIIDVGIQLPSRILHKNTATGAENVNVNISQDIYGVQFSGAQLKDGVYEGSAQGYKSTIKVSVTVENGAVTDIRILEENDTPEYFKRAEGITEDIIGSQSLNVDAVSGATYSSVGIINAVNNALEAAVTEGELENTDIVPDSSGKGGDKAGERGSGKGKNNKREKSL